MGILFSGLDQKSSGMGIGDLRKIPSKNPSEIRNHNVYFFIMDDTKKNEISSPSNPKKF